MSRNTERTLVEEPAMRRPSGTRSALLLLVLVAAGCQPGESRQEDGGKDEPAIPVETATATRGDILAVWSGTAPIEAFADAVVVAKVGGEVREISVEEGDEVVRGELLLRLDGDRLRFEARQAEANLRKLQRDYQRHVDLKERSLISEGDFEKIQYEMEALEATYDLAVLELGYTEITAPIAGVVSERFVKIGNTIDAATPVFHLTSLDPLVVYLHVPEREYRRIEPGQTASITADALQGAVFEGAVARVSPVVDPQTGTFKITVEVEDPSRRLKPGMFGRVSIVHDRRLNALKVPRNAVVEEAGTSAVFVVEDGKAHRRPVRTGYTQAGWTEILEGLDDGEPFVLVGQAGLRDGSRVAVIDAGGGSDDAVTHGVP